MDVSSCESSWTSPNEAAFRRKAWLALAPLYEAGFLNSSLEYVKKTNEKVNDGGESTRKADRDTMEASGGDGCKNEEHDTPESGPDGEDRPGGDAVTKPYYDNDTKEASTGDGCKNGEQEGPYPIQEDREELALGDTGSTEEQRGQWIKSKRCRLGKIDHRTLAQSAVIHLKRWWYEHETHPYPTKEEKRELALDSGLTKEQIDNWFSKRRYFMEGASSEVITAPGRFSPPTRFSRQAIDYLKRWWDEHDTHPYPTKAEKQELASASGLTVTQVANWYTKRRCFMKVTSGMETKPLTSQLSESNVSHLRTTQLSESAVAHLQKDQLPESSVVHPRRWFDMDESNTYPNKRQRADLASATGLTEAQVSRLLRRERKKRKKQTISSLAESTVARASGVNRSNPDSFVDLTNN